MARPALTILMIYSHKLVRADFAHGQPPVLLGFWQQARPELDDLPLLVEVAAGQGPRLRGSVWIVWSDLFAHSLRLDARSMGLQGRELQAALAFEAEPLSGISALESVVTYQQTAADKGEREFWVLQARRIDVEQLRDTVAKLGGRVAGVTSPTGLYIALPAGLDPVHADDEVFRKWLIACAGLVTDKKRKPMAIVPDARPLTSGQRWLIAVALAIPVALLCMAQVFYVSNPAVAQMKAEIKKAQDSVEKLKSLDKAIGDAGVQKDAQIKQKDTLKQLIADLGTQRKRLAGLLEQINHHWDKKRIWILRIENPGGEPTLHGLVLQPETAADFARKLREAALPLGWQVQSPRVLPTREYPGHEVWTFELSFKDVLVAAEPVPVSKTPTKPLKK